MHDSSVFRRIADTRTTANSYLNAVLVAEYDWSPKTLHFLGKQVDENLHIKHLSGIWRMVNALDEDHRTLQEFESTKWNPSRIVI